MRWRRRGSNTRAHRTGPAPVLDVGSASSVGGRTENQDRCLTIGDVVVVSDGMGGYRGGARAAELSVRAAAAVFEDDGAPTATTDRMHEAFRRANEAVRVGRAADAAVQQMGATLTVAAVTHRSAEASHWLIGHVGDSPAYLVTADATAVLTVDHTAPAQLLAAGVLTDEQAAAHHSRHMLLRAIGAEPIVEAELTEVTLQPGDALVVASDGLSGTLTAEEIGAVVRPARSAAAAATGLVEAAVARGAADNVTAVVVRHVASSGRATAST